VNITESSEVTNEADIVADIYNIGTLTSNASNLTDNDGLTNTGTLNLIGGTNVNDITNTNGIINISNDVTNTGAIANGRLNNNGNLTNESSIVADIYNLGILTSNADNLTDTDSSLVNAGTLNLTGGTNNNIITNTNAVLNLSGNMTNNAAINNGAVNNAGNVTNNALITADITNTGTLISNADNLQDTHNTLANAGTLEFTGGINTNNIAGTGTTVISGNVTNKADITNDLTLASGTLTTSTGTLNFANRAATACGGCLDTRNNTVQEQNLGNVILNATMNWLLDVNIASETADKLTAESLSGDGQISISTIKLLSDSQKYHSYATVADSTLKGAIVLATDTASAAYT
jgi:hypothetical protein